MSTPILDHPTVSSRYFFPLRQAPPSPLWVPFGGGNLACHFSRPHPGAKTVVHFHGNGEIVADYLPWMADAFAAMGVNVLFAEYRGYGASDGTPALVSMLDDVPAILAATGQPPEELIVFGRSVGSIYAIEAVHRSPGIAGLILESGIADPLQRVLLRVMPEELGVTAEALAEEAARTLDHKAKLEGFGGRLLVMHTRYDGLVDLSHAERNHAWAGGEDKQLVVFERGDHNAILPANAAAYLEHVRVFVSGGVE